jgi:cytochrome c peroxidase
VKSKSHKTKPQADTDDLFANTGEAIKNYELKITNDKSEGNKFTTKNLEQLTPQPKKYNKEI